MTPRVQPADLDTAGELAERIRSVRPGGELMMLDRVLLRAPTLAAGWRQFFDGIQTATGVPPLLRELAILRVAVLNGATYEWMKHEPVARSHGADDRWLEAVRTADPTVLGEDGAAVAALTDAMTREVAVPDAVLANALAALGTNEQTLVELVLTIGGYNLVSRVLVAFGITED